MLIIGKVHSSEDLYVDGEVRGTLEAENCRLTIGPNGKASAGARAREVDVLGRIDGDVETQEKISIRNGGQLVGDIKAAGIVIEDGAYFKAASISCGAPRRPDQRRKRHRGQQVERQFWEELVGRKICGGYAIRELIGSTDASAIYLTFQGEERVVLKLLGADETAAPAPHDIPRIDHPGIIQLYTSGDCEVAGAKYRSFVMEAADENLGAVIASRALTPDEAREMLGPLLDALAYLHERGLAHGSVKPSNILAKADSVKLSVDSIRPGRRGGFAGGGLAGSGADHRGGADAAPAGVRRSRICRSRFATSWSMHSIAIQGYGGRPDRPPCGWPER